MIEANKSASKAGILLAAIGSVFAIIVVLTHVALPIMRAEYGYFNAQLSTFAKFIVFTQRYLVAEVWISLTCFVLALLSFNWEKTLFRDK